MHEVITSQTNPLIKQIRALQQRKTREETGLFLVEGVHHVGEAIEADWEVISLVYAPERLTSEFAYTLINRVSERGIRCVALSPDLFSKVAEKDNPQGILAVVHQRHFSLDELPPAGINFGVALVSPQDPGNVGTILRTLDAAGANGLFLLDGGVDPYHPSSIRASMGTFFWKPPIQAHFDDLVTWAHMYGFQLIGSSAHATTDYRSFKRVGARVILLLGNEQKGLSQEQLHACDMTLSIPMKGRVSSLNLAVAAGILVYQILG
jgi:RNA methyltransferase, TrmH family